MSSESIKLTLIGLVLDNPRVCDEVLQKINDVAQDYENYEYGLPLHDEGSMARLREVLVHWLFHVADLSGQTVETADG